MFFNLLLYCGNKKIGNVVDDGVDAVCRINGGRGG